MSTEQAINFAKLIEMLDYIPTKLEAVEIVKWHLKNCGFNWITAQNALEALKQ